MNNFSHIQVILLLTTAVVPVASCFSIIFGILFACF
jgi:hypothetical protein